MREDKRFIIYGFGKIGQQLVDQLIEANITVDMILDSNQRKGGHYQNIDIISPREVDMQRYSETDVIISLQSREANKDAEKLLRNIGFKNVYQYYMTEKDMEMLCRDGQKLASECRICAFVEGCPKFRKMNIAKITNFNGGLEQVNVMLTSACSLNCKCCGACVPDMKREKMVIKMGFDNFKKYISCFVENHIYIHQLMISGGEPCLSTELADIIKYVEQEENIGYIKILSNGTVKLSEEVIFELQKAKKTVFWIDDYGKNLSDEKRKQILDNKVILDNREIKYNWTDASDGTWFDFGDFSFKSHAIGKYNNENCYSRHCFVVMPNGWFVNCPRAGMAMYMSKIPRNWDEVVDLNKDVILKKDIDKVIGLKYLHACEYCNGSNMDEFVAAGIQM